MKIERETGFYKVVLFSYWNVAYYDKHNDYWMFHHLKRPLKDDDLDRIVEKEIKFPI